MSFLNPGTELSNNCYRIIKFLVQGGFGNTYVAKEIGYFKIAGFKEKEHVEHEGDMVVVKELYYKGYAKHDSHTNVLQFTNDEKSAEFRKLVDKLMEEGWTLRGLQHANIVKTRDIFEENQTAYMVMDYVPGPDLNMIIKTDQQKLTKQLVLRYIFQLMSAVQHIHDKKILHLDIKPSNILLKEAEQQIVLIDFGASLTYGDDGKVKNNPNGFVTGMTQGFAPNEQSYRNNLTAFDPMFDTYAIGATLYNLLTGKLPPPGKPASFYNSEVSDYIDAIIGKAMAASREERFHSVAEFRQKLDLEAKYRLQLDRLKQKIATGAYKEALKEAACMKKDFLPTESLKKLEAAAQLPDKLESWENALKRFHPNDDEALETCGKISESYRELNGMRLFEFVQFSDGVPGRFNKISLQLSELEEYLPSDTEKTILPQSSKTAFRKRKTLPTPFPLTEKESEPKSSSQLKDNFLFSKKVYAADDPASVELERKVSYFVYTVAIIFALILLVRIIGSSESIVPDKVVGGAAADTATADFTTADTTRSNFIPISDQGLEKIKIWSDPDVEIVDVYLPMRRYADSIRHAPVKQKELDYVNRFVWKLRKKGYRYSGEQ